MRLTVLRKLVSILALSVVSGALVLSGTSPAQATSSEMLLTYHVVAGTQVELPLESHSGVTVDWGDGTVQGPLVANSSWPSHTYQAPRTVQIKLSGTITGYGGWALGREYLHSVDSFGTVGVISLSSAFNGATNLVSVPAQLPATVTMLDGMLQQTSSFNQDLSGWDVSRVVDMTAMFYHATAFNQDLSGWDTSQVEVMNNMFDGATSFNQDLSNWNIENLLAADGMFDNSGLSAQNYSAILNNWATQNVQPNIMFGAVGVNYFPSAETGRSVLTNQNAWTIMDAGSMPEPPTVGTAPNVPIAVQGEQLANTGNQSHDILTIGTTLLLWGCLVIGVRLRRTWQMLLK